MATLRRGFVNEHAAAAWFAVRQKRIYRMPVYWAARIVYAFRQTGPKDLGGGAERRGE